MKNKIKYLVGVIIFGLMFIVFSQDVNAVITGISGLPQSQIQKGNSINQPVSIIGDTASESGTLISEITSGSGIITITITTPNFTMPASVPYEKELNAVIVANSIGTAKFRFKVGAISSGEYTIEVTETAPTTGGEVVLADKCGLSTENVCKPESNLVCTPCGNKDGLPCDDSQASVCLGDVGYNGNPDDVANFPSCDVGRLGTGVITLIKDNYACSSGLICQNKQCVNDYGGQALENLGIGKVSTDIRDQIRSFINIALGFLGVAGAIIVLYGGVLWMTARGDDEQVKKAKSTIVSGVIGIVIILLAWTIVSYVLKIGGEIAT